MIADAVIRAAQAVLVWAHQGVAACMNRFNPDVDPTTAPKKKRAEKEDEEKQE